MRVLLFLFALAFVATMPAASSAGGVDDANAGMGALTAGDYAKAVQLFTKALRSKQLSSADMESAYVERGKAYLGEHNTKLATADFEHALKLNPNDQEADALRAQAQGGVAATASPAQQQFDAGKALYQSGDCAGAEAQFQQGLALDPYNPSANFYYGGCLAKDGNPGGALGPLRLAVQYGDGTPEGQMAIDEVKRLAPITSPMQGNDDGCAIPIPPPIPDGSTASKQALKDAHSRLLMFEGASDRFGACVQDLLAGFQNQAAQNGYADMDVHLRHKLQGPVDANQRDRQTVADQYSAALATFNAAHRK